MKKIDLKIITFKFNLDVGQAAHFLNDLRTYIILVASARTVYAHFYTPYSKIGYAVQNIVQSKWKQKKICKLR